MKKLLSTLLTITLLVPERIAAYLIPLGPLVARCIVGEIFFTSGWGKLQNLPQITENFISWGIPFPNILTPFVSGAEFVCGFLLVIGLFTRISGGVLGIIMIVAIKSALWEQVDSLDTLLGFSETAYLGIFFWLAITGAGKLSVDHWLIQRMNKQ